MRSPVQSGSENQYCQALDCIAADSRLLGDTRQMFTGRGRKELVPGSWGASGELPFAKALGALMRSGAPSRRVG